LPLIGVEVDFEKAILPIPDGSTAAGETLKILPAFSRAVHLNQTKVGFLAHNYL
jgi:hypothetical protein